MDDLHLLLRKRNAVSSGIAQNEVQLYPPLLCTAIVTPPNPTKSTAAVALTITKKEVFVLAQVTVILDSQCPDDRRAIYKGYFLSITY